MGSHEWTMFSGRPFSAKHHLDLSAGKDFQFCTLIMSELTHFSKREHFIHDIARELCEKVILSMCGQEWMMISGRPFSAKHHLDLSEGEYYQLCNMIGSELTHFSATGHCMCDTIKKLLKK